MKKRGPKILPLPYAPQGENSGNCGPCSLKMIADYYGIKNKNGRPYTVNSLNRLCRVTRQWGCEKSDMARVMKRLGLERKRADLRVLTRHLKQKRPILSLFIDESGVGHYAVIVGKKQDEIIFQDSYWGKYYRRSIQDYKKRARYFGNWMWAVVPKREA